MWFRPCLEYSPYCLFRKHYGLEIKSGTITSNSVSWPKSWPNRLSCSFQPHCALPFGGWHENRPPYRHNCNLHVSRIHQHGDLFIHLLPSPWPSLGSGSDFSPNAPRLGPPPAHLIRSVNNQAVRETSSLTPRLLTACCTIKLFAKPIFIAP